MILAAVGMLREARIVQGPLIRAVAGGGRSDLLLERLAAAAQDATAILSIGIGGALDPQLSVGDVLIASEVVAEARWPSDEAWADRLAAALPQARRGVVYGADDMILRSADKVLLHRRTGGALADMESHVAARFAAARGLPLAVVRVVSDAASTDLPTAVSKGLKPDGGMNLFGVLGALAAAPTSLPALIRAGREAEAAFMALRTLAPCLIA